MDLFKSPSELCDTVSIIVCCSSDNSFMFVQEPLKIDYGIPSIKVPGGTSTLKNLRLTLTEIFGREIITECLLRSSRIWLPNSNPICCYFFALQVEMDHKMRSKNTTGKFKGKIQWISENDLPRILSTNTLRSPELFDIITQWRSKRCSDIFKSDGIDSIGNFIEISESVIVTTTSNPYEELVNVYFTKEIQKTIYQAFLIATLPSLFMGFSVFTKFFSGLGWTRDEIADLFRAADLQSRKGISFREFLYLLAAVEPQSKTVTGTAFDARNILLFRFYNKDMDDMLKIEELKQILTAIRMKTGKPIDSMLIQRDLSDLYKSMKFKETMQLSLQFFVLACSSNIIDNISGIFKSAISISTYLKDIDSSSTKLNKVPEQAINGAVIPKIPMIQNNTSDNEKLLKYELATHSIKIHTAGTMKIDQMKNLLGVSPSTIERPTLDLLQKRVSMDQFDQESITNELIKSLRYMNLTNKKQNVKMTAQQAVSVFSWGNIDAQLFANRLIKICQLATDLFKAEPRLLQVSSPVYVLGDLHGNFTDLLHFESILWHVGPVLCPSNILFLGDYVDRGPSSIEVITYLFSYKIQNPNKFKMLRGNHEIREVQKMFTFQTECIIKFGDTLGLEIWNAINNTFDHLPVAAIVDKTIFCCHGGIPPPWLCPVVSCINEIPVQLNQPSEQSALAWEIFWNDPIRTNNMSTVVEIELASNEGFAENKRRGTAHIFDANALEKFLKANGFTHLIRGHEVAPEGFCVLQRGNLVNIFSSSKYCGGKNDASCLMIDQGRLRIIRIEPE